MDQKVSETVLGEGDIKTGRYVSEKRLPIMKGVADRMTSEGIPIQIEVIEQNIPDHPGEALVKVVGEEPKIGLLRFWGRVEKLEEQEKLRKG